PWCGPRSPPDRRIAADDTRQSCPRRTRPPCRPFSPSNLPLSPCRSLPRTQRFRAAMSNSFGKLFSVTTWGESHGAAVGAVVDGCPPRLPIEAAEIQADLDRRRPGQSDIVTPRKEDDRVEILSGIFEGRTTGHPISMLVRNADARPGA